MGSSWRATGLKALRVVGAAVGGPGSAINAAARVAGETPRWPTGVDYPVLRSPDHGRRLRRHTLLFAALVLVVGAVAAVAVAVFRNELPRTERREFSNGATVSPAPGRDVVYVSAAAAEAAPDLRCTAQRANGDVATLLRPDHARVIEVGPSRMRYAAVAELPLDEGPLAVRCDGIGRFYLGGATRSPWSTPGFLFLVGLVVVVAPLVLIALGGYALTRRYVIPTTLRRTR